jgi:Beta-lactamase enzyme family
MAAGYGSGMIEAPPPPAPPTVERPVSHAVSYGIVSGVAAPGTRSITVRLGARVLGRVALTHRRFSLQVDLPPQELALDVISRDSRGRTARTRIGSVQGMPTAASPVYRALRLHPPLARAVRSLVGSYGSYGGSCAVFVVDLGSGRGAAWNAQARFPAASTLKLAIAVSALGAARGVPAPGSRLDELMHRMLVVSDNMAANEIEAWFGGSTSGGSRLVNEMMRRLGLVNTEMYGGYAREPSSARGASDRAARIPLRADDQPSLRPGKYTTAYDLGSLLRAVWLASGGIGPLLRSEPGFTAADARYLLYLLARVRDSGKLDRFVRRTPGVTVMHKAGWIKAARHDNGLVVWKGGIVLVTVMAYRPSGTGVTEDALAGRAVTAALQTFRG